MILWLMMEAIIYTVLYSAFLVLLFKKQGVIRQLYNYPPKIQQRAVELGITTVEDMTANAKKNYRSVFFTSVSGCDGRIDGNHWLDFVMSDLMGIKLVRTQSIAEGATYCDFRYNRKKEKDANEIL